MPKTEVRCGRCGKPIGAPRDDGYNGICRACTVPHNSMSRQPDGSWKCDYCGARGDLNTLSSEGGCTHVYEPCSVCGLTPLCAPDCDGVLHLLATGREIDA